MATSGAARASSSFRLILMGVTPSQIEIGRATVRHGYARMPVSSAPAHYVRHALPRPQGIAWHLVFSSVRQVSIE
ncbi:hypothetical protein TPA0907_06810 [Micromonospora humidisoli]|nr:hypothetical protein TPA0907_06810 [Micromonospora sp. AKA109]